ncbi:MAG: flavodoxin [Proteobacteria bacterium]|nr:MAG: flavodoxin [Pseudomonadota bacterium]
MNLSYILCATIFSLTFGGSMSEAAAVGKEKGSIKRVFLNASKNKDGTTASLAKSIFKGLEFKAVNLVDYHLDQIGQESKADQKMKIIDELEKSKILVIGTPVYWSDMTGYLKTFIDRLDLDTDKERIKGADVYLIIQGTEPSDAISGITTVIEHVCKRFGLNYKGLIRDRSDAASVNKKLFAEAK